MMNKEEWKEKYLIELSSLNEDEKNHLDDWLIAHETKIDDFEQLSFNSAYIQSKNWIGKVEKPKNKGQCSIVTTLSNGYAIYELEDVTARQWEGYHMHHCVAHYSVDKKIFSLRDEEENSIATFEIKKNKIAQIKGKYNKGVSPRYIDSLMEGLVKLNLDIVTDDLLEIDYLAVTEEQESKILKKIFSNFKTVKVGNTKLIYLDNIKIKNQKELIQFYLTKDEIYSTFISSMATILSYCKVEELKNLVLKKRIPEVHFSDILLFAIYNGNKKLVLFLKENNIKLIKGKYKIFTMINIFIMAEYELIKDINLEFYIKDTLEYDSKKISLLLNTIASSGYLFYKDKEKKINWILDEIEKEKKIFIYDNFQLSLYYGLDEKILQKIIQLSYVDFEYALFRANILSIINTQDMKKIDFFVKMHMYYLYNNAMFKAEYQNESVDKDIRLMKMFAGEGDILRAYNRIQYLEDSHYKADFISMIERHIGIVPKLLMAFKLKFIEGK